MGKKESGLPVFLLEGELIRVGDFYSMYSLLYFMNVVPFTHFLHQVKLEWVNIKSLWLPGTGQMGGTEVPCEELQLQAALRGGETRYPLAPKPQEMCRAASSHRDCSGPRSTSPFTYYVLVERAT